MFWIWFHFVCAVPELIRFHTPVAVFLVYLSFVLFLLKFEFLKFEFWLLLLKITVIKQQP